MLPLKRVRGNRKAIQEFARRVPGRRRATGRAYASASPMRTLQSAWPPSRSSSATSVRRPRSRSRRRSAPSSARTQAREPSGSSGSRIDPGRLNELRNQPSLVSAAEIQNDRADEYRQEAHVPPKEDDVSNCTTRRRSRGGARACRADRSGEQRDEADRHRRPGFTITLKKGTAKVKTLKAGTYKITVNDSSNIHNFHLNGPA